jgi:hypothetical protein
MYGVFHHIFLSQNLLDYTFEVLQDLFAIEFLLVLQALWQRNGQFSQYSCDDMKIKPIEISLRYTILLNLIRVVRLSHYKCEYEESYESNNLDDIRITGWSPTQRSRKAYCARATR